MQLGQGSTESNQEGGGEKIKDFWERILGANDSTENLKVSCPACLL
jgi:hypothetical protein